MVAVVVIGTAACGEAPLPRAQPVPRSTDFAEPTLAPTTTTRTSSTSTTRPSSSSPTTSPIPDRSDVVPGTTAVGTSQPTTSVTVPPDFSATSPRVTWQGTTSYLHGANLPWFNFSCDFGCGDGTSGRGLGVSHPTVTQEIYNAFAGAKAAGMSVVRWWAFPGDPWQIEVGADGLPSGVDDAVYQDFDAALYLARAHDLDLVFTLFSAPSELPEAWLTTDVGRQRLATALAELFTRYADNVHTWQVFNEPEWEIWSEVVEEADVRATVEAVVTSVHENSQALVSVASARLDGLPMWIGAGLDYYTAHWYDPMGDGEACAICTTYPEVAERYALDAPLVIGEFYGGVDPVVDGRFESLFDRGYAGAWGWSLLPSHTNDELDVDLAEATIFAAARLSSP